MATITSARRLVALPFTVAYLADIGVCRGDARMPWTVMTRRVPCPVVPGQLEGYAPGLMICFTSARLPGAQQCMSMQSSDRLAASLCRPESDG
jgi:hypothetical protein